MDESYFLPLQHLVPSHSIEIYVFTHVRGVVSLPREALSVGMIKPSLVMTTYPGKTKIEIMEGRGQLKAERRPPLQQNSSKGRNPRLLHS